MEHLWGVRGYRSIGEEITSGYSGVSEATPEKIHKLKKWLAQISDILQKLSTIEIVLSPKIEKTFQYQFQSADLVKILFFQSDIQTVFADLEDYFEQSRVRNLADFETLCHLPDAGQVLALLGDSTLDLAVAQLFWESKIS